jgi:hypothetical protein
MFKSISTKVLAVFAISALMLAGCGKDEETVETSAAFSSDSSLLKYVPADTPYVFASLEPLPDDVMDQLEPMLDRVLVSYRSVLKEVIAAQQAELTEEQQNSEEAQRTKALVEEMSSLLSVQGMRDAGIARDSLMAFYGNGLLPVMRVGLSDGALFEAAIVRFEEQAGSQMTVAELAGQSYRYFDAEELRIVIAVVEDQAVFALVPAEFDDAQTGRALGLTLPDSSIAESTVLQDIISKYDYTNHVVGFVDVAAIAERFVGQPTGLDVDLMALLEQDDTELSDVCKAEIRDIAGVAPRMVIGYTGISAKRFDSSLVFELRDDIATGLQGLPAVVPGLGGDRGGLMSFGMSLDFKAARSFMEARLDAMEADPFECEHFADLQGGVAQARESLNQPLPPMVYDFKGFLTVIDEIEGLDIATQTPPTSVDGSILLAMDNAQGLVAMGAMFSPELAALNLQPGGDPVALDLPQLQAMGLSAFAALTDSAVAVSVGEKSESEVQGMLGAEGATPPPFMSFSIDAARYYSFMGEAIAAGDVGEDAPTPEMQTALKELMQSVAGLYDRMSGDILFTENGIEMHMTETLKD